MNSFFVLSVILFRWTAQGHSATGDPIHPAGRAGKDAASRAFLRELMAPLAEVASDLLRKYRPSVVEILPPGPDDFGIFPLFMCPAGLSKLHRDKNDMISFLFLIRAEKGKKGGLELGGLELGLKWEVGDVIIIDSQTLPHGSRDYGGDSKERMVGLFIIHKSMLRVRGVSNEDISNVFRRDRLPQQKELWARREAICPTPKAQVHKRKKDEEERERVQGLSKGKGVGKGPRKAQKKPMARESHGIPLTQLSSTPSSSAPSSSPLSLSSSSSSSSSSFSSSSGADSPRVSERLKKKPRRVWTDA